MPSQSVKVAGRAGASITGGAPPGRPAVMKVTPEPLAEQRVYRHRARTANVKRCGLVGVSYGNYLLF
jgi:hypothetical protein